MSFNFFIPYMEFNRERVCLCASSRTAFLSDTSQFDGNTYVGGKIRVLE